MVLRGIAKNAAWLGLIQLLNYAVPLLTLPVAARAFGPTTFGILATATAYAAYIGLFTTYGFNYAGPRTVAQSLETQDIKSLSPRLSSILGAQVFLGLVALLLSNALMFFVAFAEHYKFVVLIVSIQAFATAIAPQWIFLGLERVRDFAILQLIMRSAAAAIILAFVRKPDDLIIYVSANCAAAFLVASMAFLIAAQYGIRWQIPDIGSVLQTIKRDARLFLSTASINLYTTSNVLIVAFVLGPSAAGAFSLADRLRIASGGLVGPMADAMYPFICRVSGRGETLEEKRAKLIFFNVIITSSGAISLILLLFAPQIVWLAGGDSFKDSALVLRIIALLPLIISLSNIFGIQTMLPLHLDHQLTRIVTTAAILGVTAMFVMSQLAGLKGAALSVLAVEAFVTVAMAVVLQRRINLFSLFINQ